MPRQLEEPAEWLRYAAQDLAAAKALLTATPAMVRQALFWIQQGAEKALKAFLIGYPGESHLPSPEEA